MANWQCTARTNYVRFRDGTDEELSELCELICASTTSGVDGVALLATESDSGDFAYVGEDDDGSVAHDVFCRIAGLMEKGQVLVIQSVGAEKMKYLTGYSVAYDHNGTRIAKVCIDDIFDQLRELGHTNVSYCAY